MSRPRAATRAWFCAPLMFPLLFLLTAAVTRAAALPTVTSVNPACCNGGDTVTLMGMGFSFANKVTFGGANAASFAVANDTTITAVAPAGVGNTVVDVVVTTPSGTSPSSTRDYFYYGTPAISPAFSVTAIMPNCCNGGDTVTITGTGFSAVTRVTFGGTDAASFRVLSNTSITAVVPPGEGNTFVVVQVMSRQGSSPATEQAYFYYGTAPSSSAFSVTSVQPNFGKGGSTVTIVGAGFSAVTRVTFGGAAAASFRVLSNTSITAVVPPGEGNTTVDVQVMSREGSSPATERDYFYYGTAPPAAAAASPTPLPGLPAAGAGRDRSAAALVASLVLLGLTAASVLRRQVRLPR